MRTTKQPETDTLEVIDIDKEIRLLLRDLKFAALDALLLRVRNGDFTTEELIQLYLSLLQRGSRNESDCNEEAVIRNFRITALQRGSRNESDCNVYARLLEGL